MLKDDQSGLPNTSSYACTHALSHSHTHIYRNLTLTEKLLQRTFQKPKGKKKKPTVRTEIEAYSGSKKAGVVWESPVFVSAALRLLWKDLRAVFRGSKYV